MYVGKMVQLRAYTESDIALRLAFINDPDIAGGLTPDIPYPITLHEEKKWFEALTAMGSTYKFAIEVIDSKEFIGGCSINTVDWKNGVATIGIFIGNKNYRGKGYGTDAMKILIHFIFMQMNINKICLIVYSYNEAAIKCYKRCDFQIEGVLRKEIYKDGKYYDKIYMGLLRDDYLLAINSTS
jgi:RimJ/RimL family protein N-acetyltransferase